ncbi:beta strand repeat-containing protein [Candidatus Thioglobus sp.]|uniref:beta strand repeat-containing protein n=1 Tax=Candidatus Thioglobus sp. TaxID=2026721 RepID=UPI003D1378E1
MKSTPANNNNNFITHLRDTLLRGGRLTKYKGQLASFAPSLSTAICTPTLELGQQIGNAIGAQTRKLATGALTAAMLVVAPTALISTGAQAAAPPHCTGVNGSYVCSGSATTTQDLNSGANPLIITTLPGFNVDTASGSAFTLSSIWSSISFSDTNASVIKGQNYGIQQSSGRGSISITSNGSLTGIDGYGLSVGTGASGSSITIDVAVVSGAGGIHVNGFGSGATNITATGLVTATSYNGIEAYGSNSTTGITINAATVTAQTVGIDVDSKGSGAIDITASGLVTSTAGNGIYADNSSYGTDLTINATSVAADEFGIRADNNGKGATSITATGDVTSENSYGIYASNDGTDLTINAASVAAYSTGIHTRNFGTGGVTMIKTTGMISSVAISGIYTRNDREATDISVTAVDTTGRRHGIKAANFGKGAITIISSGTATGTSEIGIHASSTSTSTDLSITAADTMGGNFGINANNAGSGAITIVSSGAATGTNYSGIHARNHGVYGATDLSITAVETTGKTAGIYARNDGSGATTIISSGAATGAKGDGIFAHNFNTATDLSITAVDTT